MSADPNAVMNALCVASERAAKRASQLLATNAEGDELAAALLSASAVAFAAVVEAMKVQQSK